MRTHIKSRGFSLTPSLRSAVEREALEYSQRFPHLAGSLHVRLFDVNAERGGADKGCLIHARLSHSHTNAVASSLHTDLYQAITDAFTKLGRSTRSALSRHQSLRRAPRQTHLDMR